MPYQAQGQSLWSQPGIPLPPRPQLDIAGAIDAVTRGSSGLIQQAVMRKQRDAMIALEKRRVDLEEQQQRRQALMNGFVPAYDDTETTPGAAVGQISAPSALPSDAPQSPKIHAIMTGIPGREQPMQIATPGAPPSRPAPPITIREPGTTSVVHHPETYDPSRNIRSELQASRNAAQVQAAQVRAGLAQFRTFGNDVYITRADGRAPQRARDDEGNLITADRPFAFGGRMVQVDATGRITELDGSNGAPYQMTAKPGATGGSKGGTDKLTHTLSAMDREISERQRSIDNLQRQVAAGNARRATPAQRAAGNVARGQIAAQQAALDSVKTARGSFAQEQQAAAGGGAPRLSAPRKAATSVLPIQPDESAMSDADLWEFKKANGMSAADATQYVKNRTRRP